MNRFISIVNPNKPIYLLYVFQSSTAPLHGFLNSIIYGYNSTLKNEYRWLWQECVHKNDSQNNEEEEDNSDEEKPIMNKENQNKLYVTE